MQSINVTVLNPRFFTAFFGTAVVCLARALLSLFAWRHPESILRLAGCVLNFVGAILVTIVFNVPKNSALAAVDPGSPDAARVLGPVRCHMDGLESRADRRGVRSSGRACRRAKLVRCIHDKEGD